MSSSTSSPNELAAIRQEMNELRTVLAAMRDGNGNHGSFLAAAETNAATDRRGMLKKVGAIAAGVAAVGLLRPATSHGAANWGVSRNGKESNSNPDATGASLIIGQSNFPTNTADTTALVAPGSTLSPALFRVDNYSSGSLVSPGAGNVAAALFHSNNASGTPTNGNHYAVYALSTTPAGGTPIGIHGEAGADGCGIDAVCNGSVASYAVNASSDLGFGGHFAGGDTGIAIDGGRATICFLSSDNVNPPTSAISNMIGELVIDTSYNMWYSVAGGTPASFRKIAGPNTAGAAHLLATPVRYVDTRNGTGGATGAFTNGEVRSYNFTTLQSGTIPTGARGVFGNITAVSPTGNGNYQINSANSFPAGSASVMNFSSVNLANHFSAAISAAGVLFVKANVPSGGTVQLVIDIQGYYI